MNTLINLKLVTQSYRTLGLSLDASLDDCRRARNRLMKNFQYNRNPNPWLHHQGVGISRTEMIQESYLYILEHYQAIQSYLHTQ